MTSQRERQKDNNFQTNKIHTVAAFTWYHDAFPLHLHSGKAASTEAFGCSCSGSGRMNAGVFPVGDSAAVMAIPDSDICFFFVTLTANWNVALASQHQLLIWKKQKNRRWKIYWNTFAVCRK